MKDLYMKDNKDADRDNIYAFGNVSYTEHKIRICSEMCEEEKIRTLKHELCHCWMWNTANANQESYNEEHICEIVACCNDFITNTVNKYKEYIEINSNRKSRKIKKN